MNRELFGEYVKDALNWFYHPVRLRTSPLVPLLMPQDDGDESAVVSLRKLLRGAIETLRPHSGIPYGTPEWLGYRILWLRYIQARNRLATCEEIGLSQASYYRYHQEALEAVVCTLWQKYQAISRGAKEDLLHPTQSCGQAGEEVARLAREAPPHAVDMGSVLHSAEQMVQPVAQQQGISLRIVAPDSLPLLYGDPALLRQIVLNVLLEAIESVPAHRLELVVQPGEADVVLCLRGPDISHSPDSAPTNPESFHVSQNLVEAYNGRFQIADDEEGKVVLRFTLPAFRPQTILVIDDDADTRRLYQRYLQEYLIKVARSADEVKVLLQEARPHLILLDVLMPEEDGWDILNYLKATSGVADIPVIICSVLAQPRLALAMGAAEVLHKPIDQFTLLRTVKAFLVGEGTRGSRHPISP